MLRFLHYVEVVGASQLHHHSALPYRTEIHPLPHWHLQRPHPESSLARPHLELGSSVSADLCHENNVIIRCTR